MNICTQSIISGENCGLICNRKLSEDGFCRYHGRQTLDTCSICFDFVSLNDFSKSGIHVLTCGHKMHGKCYEGMLFNCETALLCPLCKRNQSTCMVKEQMATLHTEIRDLEATLENVQTLLNQSEREALDYYERYRKWKRKHQGLLTDYNELVGEFNEKDETLQQKQLEYDNKQKQFNDLKILYKRKNTKLKKLQREIVSIISPNTNNQQ
jgi:hypothetical protein